MKRLRVNIRATQETVLDQRGYLPSPKYLVQQGRTVRSLNQRKPAEWLILICHLTAKYVKVQQMRVKGSTICNL